VTTKGCTIYAPPSHHGHEPRPFLEVVSLSGAGRPIRGPLSHVAEFFQEQKMCGSDTSFGELSRDDLSAASPTHDREALIATAVRLQVHDSLVFAFKQSACLNSELM
jgi:hypothetical protein